MIHWKIMNDGENVHWLNLSHNLFESKDSHKRIINALEAHAERNIMLWQEYEEDTTGQYLNGTNVSDLIGI